MENYKTHYGSLELGTRVLKNPQMGDLLVYQFFEFENLETTHPIRLQNHPGYSFLPIEITKGQFN